MWDIQKISALFLIQICIFVNGDEVSCGELHSWECSNGACINIADRCNGHKDCKDGSDETVLECISFECTKPKFRCLYGGCVDGNSECNGTPECADNSDELSRKCHPNYRKTWQGQCSEDSFQCKSGECISLDSLCDGSPECLDRSDETVEACATNPCPPFGFRCGYGGCIEFASKCDRIFDCIDESDENHLLCGRPPPTIEPLETSNDTINRDLIYSSQLKPLQEGDCLIMGVPNNGWIKYNAPTDDILTLGHNIENYVKIKYMCNRNHLIENADLQLNTCYNGVWRNPVPECLPRCSTKIINGLTIEAKDCQYNGTAARCEDPARPGTTAQITCRNRYELTSGLSPLLTCLDSGQWSSIPQPCTPICGEIVTGTPYIVGGLNVTITQVPWHVAIYMYVENTPKFQCGGTILTERIVLSAMHCFWNRPENKPFEASLFKVVAGKENIDYVAEDRLPTQNFDVSNLRFPPDYRDSEGYFAQDIAMVFLKSLIEYRPHISPICIQHGLNYDDLQVPAGNKGVVPGWGLTSTGGSLSRILKIIDLPVVDKRQCLMESDAGFKSYITPDKFCAGERNLNVGVCEGDSGGGLVFPLIDNARLKYYIRGIVSTGAKIDSSCDVNRYTTFTNVLFFDNFIRSRLSWV